MTEGIVAACPECDYKVDRVRSDNPRGGHPRNAKRYRCDRCKATFDTPVEREPKNPTQDPSHGLARKLAQMDPDDLTA